MSKRIQNVILFVVAGAMLFSSLGAGIVLLAVNNDSKPKDDPALSVNDQDQLDNQDPAPEVDPATIPKAFIVKEDVTELKTEDLKPGSGKAVKAEDTIKFNYHGTVAKDGTVFDSSFERGEPIEFPLAELIKGWQQGLVGMKEGGRRRLIIPSDLAYGEAGSPPKIGPNTDLVFEIELLEVK